MGAPLATPAARQAWAKILRLSREGPADHEFLAEVSRLVATVVPFQASFWSAADPLTTLATSPARVENLAGQCESYWEREFLVEDFNHFRTLARAATPAGTLYRATDGRPARSIRYRELNKPCGFGDELRAVFRVGRGAWGVVSLWRGEDEPPFSLAEERLLASLSGSVGEAFRRAALLRPDPPAQAPDAPGLLMFDRSGLLELVNDQAEAWLRELPITDFKDRDARGGIPTAVLTVVAHARAIAAGIETGVACARIQSRTGRWLVLHGFSLRGADGDDSRTALVIEPAKASQVAPIIVEGYQLGPREQEITQMIARGLSTVEIAARLHLSPHTVRDYIKQVFEKAGVSSRGELVAKVFAEHYLQPLHADVRSV